MTMLAWLFVAMAIALAALLVLGVYVSWKRTGSTTQSSMRSAVITAVVAMLWLVVTHALSSRGLLHFDSSPPTMVILIVVLTAITIGIGVSPVGQRLGTGIPLAVLVGVQGFRLPLELMLHRAYETGLMPVQMSYGGLNVDIVTGVSAIALSLLLISGLAGTRAVRFWNVLGSLLLLNVVVIALLSAPTPLRVFRNDPPNVWITQPPYVFLPTVMVAFAILGHIVIFRALQRS
jgi:hypothetical protein